MEQLGFRDHRVKIPTNEVTDKLVSYFSMQLTLQLVSILIANISFPAGTESLFIYFEFYFVIDNFS